MPKLCPNIRFPHQQDFFPIKSVTKSSTSRFSHENLVEKFKIFVKDFVPIRTALKSGSYGNKIFYKNLNFFDKIFVRKARHRRFRLWGKNIVEGKMFWLGMVSTNLYMLFLWGRNKIQTEMATYFFLQVGEICKSKQSYCSTVLLPVKHRHQRMWRFYPRQMFSILSRRCPLLATSCPSFSVCFPCSSPIPG